MDMELEFSWTGRKLRDLRTGSLWNLKTGIAVHGQLAGTAMKRLPFGTAYDWAWGEFHPDTEAYRGDGGFSPEAPLEGNIGAVRPLVIGGHAVELTRSTEVQGLLRMGEVAKVTGRLKDDGTTVPASRIEIVEDPHR